MQSAPLPHNEAARLTALNELAILDTESEKSFDELTKLASAICDAPISLISLIDENRQWFKSKVGLEAEQTPRSLAFCAHAILQEEVFEVPNALEDPRFFDNPLVTSAPDIRFYAGAPLFSPDGLTLGTLCVIDRQPRQLNDQQREALRILSNQVVNQMLLRKHTRELETVSRERDKFFALIAHDLRSPFNSIMGFSRRLSEKSGKLTSEQVAGAANNILMSAQKVYQLLDELLQWSQQRLGNHANKPQLHTLQPLVQQTVDVVSDILTLKNIKLDIAVDSTLQIFADPTLTKTVIRNLLTNAIKFTPTNGHIDILVSKEDGWVNITVADNGPGVPAHLAKQLFEQDVESTSGSEGEIGTGMGLRLCYEFAKRIGGELVLDTTNSDGTRITFKVPSQSI